MTKTVPKKRSEMMTKIRSKGNKTPEWKVRSELIRSGVKGWVLHPANVFGRPDFFFKSRSIAIFVDGCFWHNCPRCGHIPKSRKDYWMPKLKRNKMRDALVSKTLRKQNILVLRIWEHESAQRLRHILSPLFPRSSGGSR